MAHLPAGGVKADQVDPLVRAKRGVLAPDKERHAGSAHAVRQSLGDCDRARQSQFPSLPKGFSGDCRGLTIAVCERGPGDVVGAVWKRGTTRSGKVEK